MTDRNKFEEMLERLVNEDKAGAEELFHEIVVAKSRDIYESLLESDLDAIDEASKDNKDDEDEVDESSHDKDDEDDDKVDEASKDDDEDDLDENFNLDEFEVEGEDDMMGGDPADDMMGDMKSDSGDMMGGEDKGDMEDRVVDLEDALDDLKAEFEKMMAGEDGDEESDDEDDMDDMDDDEEGEEGEEKEAFNFGEAEDDEEDKVEERSRPMSNTEQMREYVEKVTAKMGDNGVNSKSTVAGKNNMGGTSANIVKGGESKSQGTNGGLAAPTSKEENAGNVNVPGGKASKSMKAEPKGHGAEKKGAGEQAADKKSIISGR